MPQNDVPVSHIHHLHRSTLLSLFSLNPSPLVSVSFIPAVIPSCIFMCTLVLRKRRIWFCGSRINPARVSTVWFDERNFHFRLNLSCSSSYIYTVNVFIGLRILYALSRSVLFLLSLMSSIECIAIAVLCVNDYKQRKRTDCISSSLSLSLPCVCV